MAVVDAVEVTAAATHWFSGIDNRGTVCDPSHAGIYCRHGAPEGIPPQDRAVLVGKLWNNNSTTVWWMPEQDAIRLFGTGVMAFSAEQLGSYARCTIEEFVQKWNDEEMAAEVFDAIQ